MTCEIENTVTRPNGPYGDVVTNGRCLTHGFRTYGIALEVAHNGPLCPLGQIYAARDAVVAQIHALTTVPMTEAALGIDTAPHKRPRKPKPTEE